MSEFVLDNSVAMRWLLSTKKAADQKYAENVLVSLSDTTAVVPNLWHLEVVNVLSNAMRSGELELAEATGFISQLDSLPLSIDPLTAQQAFGETMMLTQGYKLSSYDAAYLEVAIRNQLPLATLDATLTKAAKKAGVAMYLR